MSVNNWGSINAWQGGGSVTIPSSSRGTYQDIADYLKSQDFAGTTNDIIFEWLKSGGVVGVQFNDLFYNYWGQKGYVGAYNDRWKSWKGE